MRTKKHILFQRVVMAVAIAMPVAYKIAGFTVDIFLSILVGLLIGSALCFWTELSGAISAVLLAVKFFGQDVKHNSAKPKRRRAMSRDRPRRQAKVAHC
jgi:polyferredoxin